MMTYQDQIRSTAQSAAVLATLAYSGPKDRLPLRALRALASAEAEVHDAGLALIVEFVDFDPETGRTRRSLSMLCGAPTQAGPPCRSNSSRWAADDRCHRHTTDPDEPGCRERETRRRDSAYAWWDEAGPTTRPRLDPETGLAIPPRSARRP